MLDPMKLTGEENVSVINRITGKRVGYNSMSISYAPKSVRETYFGIWIYVGIMFLIIFKNASILQ